MTEGWAADRLLRAISILAAAASLAIGTVILVSTLINVSQSHFLGPINDFWKFLPLLEAIDRGENPWSMLVEDHSSHRLILPRLFYLAEYSFLRGQNIFLVSASVTLNFIMLVILIRTIAFKGAPLLRSERWFTAGLIAALTFSGTQLENLVRPWHIHWFLCCCAAIGSLAAVIRIRDSYAKGSRRMAWCWWSAAIGAACASTFSMANGLLIWPALLFSGFILKAPKRFLAGIAAAACGVMGLYYTGIGVNVVHRLGHRAGDKLEWMLKCLGAPVSWKHESTGVVLAVLGTLAAAAMVLRLVTRRSAATPREALLLGLLVFSWTSVAMIAFGRVSFPWIMPRYQTVVLLFWLSLALLGMFQFRGSRVSHRAARTGLMAMVTLWLCVVLIPAHFNSSRIVGRFVERVRDGNTAILVGVEHRALYRILLPRFDRMNKTDSVAQYRSFLLDNRLGVFSEGLYELIGQTLTTRFAVADSSACRGAVDERVQALQQDEGAVRMRGWLSGVSDAPAPRVLLATNQDGIIIGLGRVVRHTFDPLGWRSDVEIPWVGYALIDEGMIDIWALLGSDQVCTIARRERIVGEAVGQGFPAM